MRNRSIAAITLSAVLVLAALAVPRVTSAMWEAPEARLALAGCFASECELTGSLRVDPWTKGFVLTRTDGTVVQLRVTEPIRISYMQGHYRFHNLRYLFG